MERTLLYVLGALLTVMGVVGYFNNPVLGIFAVDSLHNIIHIVTGLVLLGVAKVGGDSMQMGAKIFGVVYALIAVVGFVQGDTVLNLIEANMAGHVLHAAIAVVLLYVGFAPLGSKSEPIPMQDESPAAM